MKIKVKGKITISRTTLTWAPDDVTTAQAIRAQVNSLKGEIITEASNTLVIRTEPRNNHKYFMFMHVCPGGKCTDLDLSVCCW